MLIRFDLLRHLHVMARRCYEIEQAPPRMRRRLGYGRDQAGNKDEPGYLRYSLPYCLEPSDSACDRLVVLNRDYKPAGLGIPYSVTVDYAAFDAWTIGGEVAARVRAASCWAHSDGLALWLFQDGCVPWRSIADLRAYVQRLAQLVAAIAPASNLPNPAASPESCDP